jgi:hypothetical protein
MMHGRRFGGFFLMIPVIVAGVAALLALAVHGLWNGVLTDVAGVKAITYGQALGLLVLARILVGGFPRLGGHFGPRGRHMMMEHWESLTPEQREKLRAGMGLRGGWGPPWGGPQNVAPSTESDKGAEGGPAKV